MSPTRCSNCGGLVRADAQWCGQCLTPLGASLPSGPPSPPREAGPAPDPAAPEAQSSSTHAATPGRPAAPGPTRPIRAGQAGIVWECPTCGTENSMESPTCRGCGTSFSRLLQEERAGPRVEPGRAVMLSLFFPGLGHAAVGRMAEGLARGVVFAFALGTVVTILIARSGQGIGPFLTILLISAAFGISLYAVTAVDAGRVARGESPILSTRALLFGAVGLMLLTAMVLVILGVRAVGSVS